MQQPTIRQPTGHRATAGTRRRTHCRMLPPISRKMPRRTMWPRRRTTDSRTCLWMASPRLRATDRRTCRRKRSKRRPQMAQAVRMHSEKPGRMRRVARTWGRRVRRRRRAADWRPGRPRAEEGSVPSDLGSAISMGTGACTTGSAARACARAARAFHRCASLTGWAVLRTTSVVPATATRGSALRRHALATEPRAPHRAIAVPTTAPLETCARRRPVRRTGSHALPARSVAPTRAGPTVGASRGSARRTGPRAFLPSSAVRTSATSRSAPSPHACRMKTTARTRRSAARTNATIRPTRACPDAGVEALRTTTGGTQQAEPGGDPSTRREIAVPRGDRQSR